MVFPVSSAGRFTMLSSKTRWLVLCLCLLSLTGCRGCQLPIFSKDEKAKIDGTGKPQPLPRLELTSLQARPTSGTDGLNMKPNHWYELQQSARANESDEALTIRCTTNERAFPYSPNSILGNREPIAFERNVSLARGQRKLLALEAFFPRMHATMQDNESLGRQSMRVAYLPRTIGAAVREEAYPVTAMPDYQYNLVVLSQNPDRYQFIGGMSCIVWPSEAKKEDERISPFRVVQVAQAQAQENLPSCLLAWTSTSHLLWNDCAASALVEKQQAALVDWIQFGGQLMINGPESQAALKGSFLSKYAPLVNLRSGKLDAARWGEFSNHWSRVRWGEKKVQEINLPTDYKPPLIEGDLAKGAKWVQGCEGMVAELEVGGGRVVMTTFSLGEAMMVRWPSFSSFFNAAMLHRPPRIWQATSTGLNGDMVLAGALQGKERDPRYVSRVRLLGRDLGRDVPTWSGQVPSDTGSRTGRMDVPSDEAILAMSQRVKVQQIENQGVAQVESDSVFASIATVALQKASGIQVPRVKTIVQLLAGYFIVLVPLNWVVFRLLGRVEFAWLAAPVIAMVGAVVVAKAVQLDVGFSRSQTAINLLELKSGYPRGHLSSYLSLYTSLSTNYSARYPNNEGIVLPIANAPKRSGTMRSDENSLHYEYGANAGAGLISFPVRSNSTSFMRGEDLIDMEGAVEIAWDDEQAQTVRFKNASSVILNECAVIANSQDGQMSQAWIGELGKEASGSLQLIKIRDFPGKSDERASDFFEEWRNASDRNSPEFSKAKSSESRRKQSGLQLRTMLDQILVRHRYGLGEVVMVGWTDQSLMKMELKPKASQLDEMTLVVVRLDAPDLSSVAPDVNLPSPKIVEELDPKLETSAF